MEERRDAHRSAIQEAEEGAPNRIHSRQGGRQGGDRREIGTQVPRLGSTPQSTSRAAPLANSSRPVPRRLVRTRSATPTQSGAPGENAFPRPATTLSGELSRRSTPLPSAANQVLARPGGTSQGS